MKKKLVIVSCLVIVLLVIVVTQSRSPKANGQAEGLVYYPPNSGMYENYVVDAKTYESKLGFSFKYPPHLFVMEDPEADIPERLFIMPTSTKDTGNGYGIIISIAENDENMTPLEWLDGPSSGANMPSEGYLYKWNLGGQEAVAIDGGTWVVVNTPGNKYRLSIALLPSKNGDQLFTEMGIVIDSLRFAEDR